MSSEKYCVYYHDVRFKIYHVYYSNGEYKEFYIDKKSDVDFGCHNFEHSRLTKYTIREKLKEGISLKDILAEYCEKLLIWNEEFKTCKTVQKGYNFFEDFYKQDGTPFLKTNESNILRFFNLFKSKKFHESKWDKQTWTEYKWFEKSYNGGLLKCIPGKYKCLGLDFKMSYPVILASKLEINKELREFHFPVYEGREKKYKKLPAKLKYGLYHVEIKSDSEEFNSVFNYKYDTNIYAHYDIELCRKYQKEHNISITLLQDEEYNALVYTDDQIINSKKVFGYWFELIKQLKEELPNNGLVKLISSSIWGYLSKINKKYYSDEELDNDESIKFDYEDNPDCNYSCLREKDNHDGSMAYMLINKENPYCKKYRLKPFITSFQRCVIADIALSLKVSLKIVRINTDCIVFNKDLLTKKEKKKLLNISPTFIKEKKTSGLLHIHNVNDLERITEL